MKSNFLIMPNLKNSARVAKTTVFCLLFGLISFSLFGFGGQDLPDNGKKNVAVTFDAIKELTLAVTKDKVNVSVIIPEGMEPHHFEPKAKDLAFLSKADVLIFNGLEMEFWLEDALKAVNNKKLLKIEASKGIEPIKASHHHHKEGEVCPMCGQVHNHKSVHTEKKHGHQHCCQHGEFDPHTWLGLSSAKIMVHNIAKEISKVDSKNAAFYQANAKDYIAQLDKLLTEYRAKFQALNNKKFVTGHAAFAYLCRDFGLEQSAVMGVFAEGEPNAKELAALVEHCKEHHIKTIFSEEAASPQVSKTLAKEVGAKVEKIYTIEMPAENKSYLERMKLNLERIYENLKF